MSLSHEHELILQSIKANLHRLHELLPLGPAEDDEPSIVSADFVETRPVEFRADLVVTYGNPPRLCRIVEVQRGIDPKKPAAWLHYQHQAQSAFGCPVQLIVVATSARVARWARRAYEQRAAFVQAPLFVGPESIPPSPCDSEGELDVELALFRAFFFRRRPEGPALLDVAWQVIRLEITNESLDEERIGDYLSVLRILATKKWWKTVVEADMRYENVLDQARAETKRDAIRHIASVRGMKLDDESRRRLAKTRDLEKLDRWLTLAATHEQPTLHLD